MAETSAVAPKRRGLRWQSAGGGYVAALCYAAPREVALSSLVEWARSKGCSVKGVVIEDLRGGLDAARSDCLRRLSAMLNAPIVVLSGSALTRGAAACHWLGERVYAFRRGDVDAAMEWLDVDEASRQPLQSALWALKVARRLERTHKAEPRVRRAGSSAG